MVHIAIDRVAYLLCTGGFLAAGNHKSRPAGHRPTGRSALYRLPYLRSMYSHNGQRKPI